MYRVIDLIAKGGPIMISIVGLSIATFACTFEWAWFWYQLLQEENRVVHDVLDAAHYDLEKAAAIAARAQNIANGRFLSAPLKLKQPTPETFRLALEAAGDEAIAFP